MQNEKLQINKQTNESNRQHTQNNNNNNNNNESELCIYNKIRD